MYIAPINTNKQRESKMETNLGKALAEQFNSDAIEQIIEACDAAVNLLRDKAREQPFARSVTGPILADMGSFAQISAVLRQLRV